ncbi:MAG: hypothetical protein ACREKH_07380 [Candidatus Rokuibacteriota bacterium]
MRRFDRSIELGVRPIHLGSLSQALPAPEALPPGYPEAVRPWVANPSALWGPQPGDAPPAFPPLSRAAPLKSIVYQRVPGVVTRDARGRETVLSYTYRSDFGLPGDRTEERVRGQLLLGRRVLYHNQGDATKWNWSEGAVCDALEKIFAEYAEEADELVADFRSTTMAGRCQALAMELRFASEMLGNWGRAVRSAANADNAEKRRAARAAAEKANAWIAGAWKTMEDYGSYVGAAIIGTVAVSVAAGAAGATTVAAATTTALSTTAAIGAVAGPAMLVAIAAVMAYIIATQVDFSFTSRGGRPTVDLPMIRPLDVGTARERTVEVTPAHVEVYVHALRKSLNLYRWRAAHPPMDAPAAGDEAAHGPRRRDQREPQEHPWDRARARTGPSAGAKTALILGGGASAAGLVWWLWKKFPRRTR